MSIYDAVVDTDEKKAEFTLPSAAFSAGRMNVFVRRGVYNETADVVIPDGGKLTGEIRGQTIIDFGAAGYSVKCQSGSLPISVESTGTLTLTSGVATVEGVGTTFTNISAGQFISIHSNTFEVKSVEDDTNLTLTQPYNGVSVSDIPFKALSMYSYNQVANITIRNSSTTGLSMAGCRRLMMDGICVSNCTPNILLDNCAEVMFRTSFIEFAGGIGLSINACNASTFSTLQALSNLSHGVATTGICNDLLFHDVESASNGGCGMYVNGSFKDGNLTNCVMKRNYSHGLYTNSSGDNFVVNASNIEANGGSGAECHGARGIFSNNTFKNNAGIGCDITGDFCIVGKSIGFNNSYGIQVAGSACNVCDNSFTDSANDCCHIMSGAEDTTVTGNHFNNAGNSNLNDEGTNTLANNNKP